MAGTIQPIAALTDDDLGPINTIFSIFLPITSVLISIVRLAIRKQKLRQFEPDDVVFAIALAFGILTSILSHQCVQAGLGKHQRTLGQVQVARYFKFFWFTQISTVLSLALAKSSLVLLLKRLTPKQTGHHSVRLLLPAVTIYAFLCLLLIAFQCQLPEPWILSPSKCSTHGAIYYPITILNMLTDALLAIWIFPTMWNLQTRPHTKSIVMWLFGSRLLVCVVDIGRMKVIHTALQSEDQTRSQLLWAVMDQIVVHLSINHATLPRIQTFLSHLQIGNMSPHIPAVRSCVRTSEARGSTIAGRDCSQQRVTVQRSKSQSRSGNLRWKSYNIWNALYNNLTGSLKRASSVSEQPLRYQQEQGIELITTVSVSNRDLGQTGVDHRELEASSMLDDRPRKGLPGGLGGVRVQKEIHVTYT